MRQAKWLFLMLIIFGLGGCSSPNSPTPKPDPDPKPEVELECQRQNYPCTFAKVDDAILTESLKLLNDIATMREEGESMPDILAWLKGQDKMAKVTGDESAITFRLDAGRPMVLIGRSIGGSLSETSTVSLRQPLEAALQTQEVIGSGNKKTALILAPFAAELKEYDSAIAAEQALNSLDEFKGNVKVLPNAQADVEAFVNNDFSKYDVVYISTHGSEASLTTGEKLSGDLTLEQVKAKLREYDEVGVHASKIDDSADWHIGLGKEFFNANQGSNQNKNLIVLDGCSIYGGSEGLEFAQLLAGPNGAVVGWNKDVHADVSKRTIKALFDEMIDTGLSLDDAITNIFNRGFGQDKDTGASIRARGNVRIRDIISFTQVELVGEADDDKDDKLKLSVKVDGIKPGQESEFTIDFAMDGANIGQAEIKAADAAKDFDYTYEITTDPLDTGLDIKAGQPYIIEATVTLPEGGVSQTSYTLIIRCSSGSLSVQQSCEGPTLKFHSILEQSTAASIISSEVKAEISLSVGNEDNILKGSGTLSYVNFVYSVSGSECLITTSTKDGTLEVVKVEFPTDDNGKVISDIPNKVVLRPNKDIFESIYCNGNPVLIDHIHWFAGFISWHGGSLGGENEIDEAEGGIVMRNWSKASDGVLRKTYERSFTGGDPAQTYTEATTIELANSDLR